MDKSGIFTPHCCAVCTMASNVQMMRDAISGLLESLYDMGMDEETVAIAAENQMNRESLHCDILLQRIKAARVALGRAIGS